MKDLRPVIKDYRDAGALNSLVAIQSAVDKQTFQAKSGDILTVARVEGIDYECLDPEQMDQVARRFEAAVHSVSEDCRFYQYLVRRTRPPLVTKSYADPIVQTAVADRAEQLACKSADLVDLDIYFVIAYEGWHHGSSTPLTWASWFVRPLDALKIVLSAKTRVAQLDSSLDRAREVLANKVNNLVIQLQESVKLTVLDKHEAFRFFRRLLNYAPHKADGVHLRYDAYVDFQACGSTVECYRDHLRVDDAYVQVLTLKQPPAQTWANILKGLDALPCEFVIATEWKRTANHAMLRLINSKRRHFDNGKRALQSYLTQSGDSPKDALVDDGAQAQIIDLGQCIKELDFEGNYFGEFSMTLVLYGNDHSKLRRAAAETFKIFSSAGAQLMDERYNLLNAFVAILPGNHLFNLRRMWLLNTNYADLALLFTSHTGNPENTYLRADCLAVLETDHGTPYFLNLHWDDLAHAFILGQPGSGKSFLANFLITHLQKYSPRTFIFDLGGSYSSLTELFRGAYVPVGLEKQAFSINPFCLPLTEENRHFLFSFVRVLIESSGHVLNSQDEKDLFEQIDNLYQIDADHRRLRTLASILNRNLAQALAKWVEGGPYARLFDNQEDNLSFANFQTFDFEGMDKIPQVLEPLLFYLLHRANSVICDPALATTFKAFVMDEAWRFLKHPTINAYIQEALKTWRRKNAAMILITQSGGDFLDSEMLPIIVESCPTKIFLANPGIDRETYKRIFHLNETEAKRIARLIPKQQLLIKRPDFAKVVNLNVSPKEYWLYTSNPYDVMRKREAFERYGFEQGLEMLAKGGFPNDTK